MAKQPTDISGHIVKSYDRELGLVRGQLLEMGGLVEDQIGRAVSALTNADLAVAREVIARNQRIHAMEAMIDHTCTHLIARRQPMGRDLRMILTLSKAVMDLERIGDETQKVAQVALHIYEGVRAAPPSLRLFKGIHHSAKIATAMVQGCLDAFARNDGERALEVIYRDDELDEAYHNAITRLTNVMSQDSGAIPQALNIIFIHKALERMGDHAKNIAEHVVYFIEGRNVGRTEPNPQEHRPQARERTLREGSDDEDESKQPASPALATAHLSTAQLMTSATPTALRYSASASKSALVNG